MPDRAVNPDRAVIPDPAMVVLIGAAGSGKSTWAQARYRRSEIVSSDELRSIVGSGPADLDASTDAFALLDTITSARAGRGLTCVVDTLGLDIDRRRGYLTLARRTGLRAVAVVIDTDPATCRARNAMRDRPVPAPVLAAQFARMRSVRSELIAEGWDQLVEDGQPATNATQPAPSRQPAPTLPSASVGGWDRSAELSFYLQISRFPWGSDPGEWLGSIALAALESGFQGLAVMDHLIQIPQVGRAWEPIPEPFVTLGFLAGMLATIARTGSTGADEGGSPAAAGAGGTSVPLRLGTLVSPVTMRAPGVLAKTVATLDVLTAGGAFCGIGAGWWEREHRAFGLPFPPATERLNQLETAIAAIRALWAPGTKSFSNDGISLQETTCYPRPAGNVPIIVGGGGERRTLRIAARLGDGCNLPSDPVTLDRKIPVLRRHCAEVGRPVEEVAITVLDVPVIGGDREEVATIIERLRGRTAASTFVRRHPAGIVPDHIRRYRALVDRGVSTVFLALPDLTGPGEVLRCAPLTAAFR